jgi:ribosome-binding protein aMBF1 (putative translation factor)
MKKNTNNTTTHSDFEDKYFGKKGTKSREEYEQGFEEFKVGAMLLQARHDKGMTQEQLAKKVGTTKSYISRLENNFKEARISTLQKIVELGFGGKLELKLVL